MTVKKLTGVVHLWLGLLSGLVVFIVSLTGAMYVFQEEIEIRLMHPRRHFVAKQNQSFAPISVWLSKANAAFAPYDSLSGSRNVYWHRDEESRRTVSVGTSYQAKGEEHYIEAFLNPYTGQVLEVAETSGKYDFWRIVIDLHINLLLGEVGNQVVRYSTLIFLVMLISGIVLWWPRNKAALKQRYWFRWKQSTQWKRKNYDLHNVLGFYVSWVVVFMAITGLVWSFTWFDKGMYYLLSGGEVSAEPSKRVSDTLTTTNAGQLERSFARFQREHPAAYQQANAFYISYPTNIGRGDITIYTYFDPAGLIEADYSEYRYDRVTTRFIQQGSRGRSRQNAGDWFRDFNGAIHYGSLFGLPSKILVFFACLLTASLPVTGFLIWWGRRRFGHRGHGRRKRVSESSVKAPFVMRNSAFFWAIVFLVFSKLTASKAQNAPPYLVKGSLLDSTSRKPIEFATIGILSQQNKVVALTYSDENGVFKSADMSAGSYILNLSFVGYAPKTILFSVSEASPIADIGTLYLRSEARQLTAVTVTSIRQLVEQQPGMLIYNAEKDISNQGGTAADVLRKAPVLNVDAAGNVTMRGNRNLRILINGKYSGQMARNAADALNMMPATSIKAVEVITSPSARYDAEGAAGVINIITKKGQQQMSGTVEVVAGNLEQAVNPRIAINRDKWTISSYLHIHQIRSREEVNLNRLTLENGQQTGRIQQAVIQDNLKPHGSGDLQIEFAPNAANLFTFSANGWLGTWPDNRDQHTQRYSATEILLEDFQQHVTTRAPNRGINLNLGYTHKFTRPGEELYLMAQHNNSADDYDYDARQTTANQQFLYREINNNHTVNQEWTFQADYVLPVGKSSKHAWESGGKLILRDNRSGYQVSASTDANPDQLMPVASRTDLFSYRQDVAAAYSQIKFKWSNGWALHAGTRLEGTFLSGRQQDQNSAFSNQFWNVVPSATLFKRLNANNNLTLSYTKRISRPSIWDLNPNQNAQDPKNLEVGNPLLRPEQVDQVELTYALQTDSDFFLNASLFGRETTNSIESLIRTDASGVATTTKQNLASNQQFGLNLSTSFNVLPNWKINSNANLRHARFQSGALAISNSGVAWGINVNSSWKLPNRCSLQAYTDYDARSVTLQGSEGNRFYYSFSAKKEIAAPKLTITLTSVSPFGGYISQTELTRGTGFETTVQNRYLMRSIRLSLNWELGGPAKASNSRKIKNDDQKNGKSNG